METDWEPTLFVDEQATALLTAAVRHVSVMDCQNHCAHHVPGRSCIDCPHFRAASGYIMCDAYEQEEEQTAENRGGRRKAAAAAIAAAFLAFSLAGCATAAADPVDDAFARVDDVIVERHVDADEQVRWDCLEMLPEMMAERDEGPCDSECYDYGCDFETTCYDYGGDYSNPFKANGEAYDENYSYTWYSQRQLSGSGLTALNSNGRHVDESTGFIVDGDGYIAVAMNGVEQGTVIETIWGEAKVYDVKRDNAPYDGQVDVYTDF